MIIDMATRVCGGPGVRAGLGGVGGPVDGEGGFEEHDNATAGTGVTLVLGYRSGLLGVEVANEALAAHVGLRGDRRLLVAGLDLGAADVELELDRAQELGAVGVAVSPADQGVRPTDERARAVMESCAGRGLFVHVTNPRLSDPRSVASFASPVLFDDAAREVKGLRLVFGDLGRAFTDEALMMIGKHACAFAEVSAIVTRPMTMLRVLSEAFEGGMIEKLLFGSGFPEATPAQAIEAMYQLQAAARRDSLSGLTRQAVRGIIERDSLALLGVRAPGGAVPAPRVVRQRAPVVSSAAASWRGEGG